MLEIHRMRGRMFGLAHMIKIWSIWHQSPGQLGWVLNPGNPNQVYEELIMYYFALIAAAVLACLEVKLSVGDMSGVSAVEVLDYMINSAKANPMYC